MHFRLVDIILLGQCVLVEQRVTALGVEDVSKR